MGKFVFLDRDGVINKRSNVKGHRWYYVSHWSDFQWIPGAKQAVARLLNNDYQVIVVSNQGGIAAGNLTRPQADKLFFRMACEIWKATDKKRTLDESIHWAFCPHARDFGCACRKPKPGMLYSQMLKYELRPAEGWMIGDRPSDMKAGWNAGIRKLIKLPSLEEPEAPEYSYGERCRNFVRRRASGVLIDSLPHAVDFLLAWDAKNP